MTRYATYGRLDTQLVESGDIAFTGMNSRDQSNRLKPGEVAEAKNVRMDDGIVTTRLGYSIKVDLSAVGLLSDELGNEIHLEQGGGIEVADPLQGDFFAVTKYPGIGLSDKNQIAMVRKSDVTFWNGSILYSKPFQTSLLTDPVLPLSLDFILAKQNPSAKPYTVGGDIEPIQFNNQFILLSGSGPILPVNLEFTLRQDVQKWDGGSSTQFVVDPDIPNGDFGVVVSNRLAIVTAPDIIEFSDIINESNYDIFGKFYIGVGDGDNITALTPVPESTCVVFKRNSIWGIGGLNTGVLTDAYIFHISKSSGCVSRHSVQTIGSAIFFLSDNGVFLIDVGIDGATGRSVLTRFDLQNEPLSKPINDQILSEDFSLAEKNCRSVFFRNRYYLSFSSDQSSRCYIYNTLTGSWESRDEYGFRISDFVVARTTVDSQEQLYVADRFGYLYKFDEGETDSGNTINWELSTRSYDNDNLEIKNYRRGYIKAESLDSTGTTDLTVNLKEPDGSFAIPIERPEVESYIQRFSIGRRGNSLQYNFKGTGRSKVKHCRAEFIEANENLIQTYK